MKGNGGMELLERVRQTITDEKLLQPRDKIVVAVSGGPDSVALLHLLHRLSGRMGWELIVAHVNHQFRREESAREATYVSALAEQLQIHCEVGEIDVPEYILQHALNAQAAAREKRYEFLHQVAARYGAGKIALAHHADDQAETVLMRIIRGTGPSGLAGIASKRREHNVDLIRPLMGIYKSEIMAFLHANGIEACRDSSNEQRKYFRNQLRLDVMPFLQQYNNQLPQSLNRLARVMRDEGDFIENEAKRILADLVSVSPTQCTFSRKNFIGLHSALQRRLIKLILDYLSAQTNISYDFTQVELIRSGITEEKSGSAQLDVSKHIRFVREYDRIMVHQQADRDGSQQDKHYRYVIHNISLSGELNVPEANADLFYRLEMASNSHDASAAKDKHIALFDMDGVDFPLTVRNRFPGDRIEIMGLNGSKKVKDIFIDDKIGKSLRNSIPLLVDARDRVLWIPGIRRSKHAWLSERTKRVLRMELRRSDPL
jgi:tRNA(Ile)-lysidine synthase